MTENGFGRGLLVAVVTLAILIFAGVIEVNPNSARAGLFSSNDKTSSGEGTEPFWQDGSTETVPVSPPQGAPLSFAELAEQVSPSVVNIQTSKIITRDPHQPYNPFEDFFGPGPDFFHRGSPTRRKQIIPSLGSGFVISTDGYIVTNNHVVEETDSIKVAFQDGSELDAEIVGRDPKTDIALIRVEAKKPLVALPFGDSEVIRAGDWVIAIGNPYGLGHTVTAGIVSAKGRAIGLGPYDNFIQTDTAINPGNSGGPLINLRGEVVGINTAINPRANTIGFAVPINMAKDILPQLRATGRVTRGWLGVIIQPITPELAESFGLDEAHGALVNGIAQGGPADKAGFEVGDIITEFNGHEIEDMEDLPRVVAATPVGKKVNVTVLRNGKAKTISVIIGELPDEFTDHPAPEDGEELEEHGIRAQALTPEIAEQLGIEDLHGVVVTDIAIGSPADDAGLRRGDVILEANRQPVKSLGDLHDQLSADTEKGTLLLVRRGETTLFVALKPLE